MVTAANASNGRESIDVVHRLPSDVALKDLEMPGMNGVDGLGIIGPTSVC